MSNNVRNLVKSRVITGSRLRYIQRGKAKTKAVGSAIRKNVLLAMADRANDDGESIFMANNTLADETGFSVRGVTQAISTLKEDGLIQRVGQKKVQNGWINVYAINLEQVKALPLTPSQSILRTPTVKKHPVQDDEAPGAGHFMHPVPTRRPMKHLNISTAEKKENKSDVVKSARKKTSVADVPDHLVDDSDFQHFLDMQEARAKDLNSDRL